MNLKSLNFIEAFFYGWLFYRIANDTNAKIFRVGHTVSVKQYKKQTKKFLDFGGNLGRKTESLLRDQYNIINCVKFYINSIFCDVINITISSVIVSLLIV